MKIRILKTPKWHKDIVNQEAERAQQAFDALTPEEQVDVMNYAQQREQAEEAAMQEQAMAQEAMAQQQMAMQQPMQEVPQEPMPQEQMAIPTEGNISAEGGQLNTFAGTQSGSNQMRNAGTWKKGTSAENWNTYTRGGLRDYLQSIAERVKKAKNIKEVDAIRQEAVDTVAKVQNAYRKAYQAGLTPSAENEAVKELQEIFQGVNGNKYFGKIADNINLPKGHNTLDTEAGGWVDSLWGPRTSIRNWGSTEYGDLDYKELADLAKQAGLNYMVNPEWTYGNTDNPYQLYGLSFLDPTSEEGMQFDADWVNRDLENYNNQNTTPGTAKATTPSDVSTADNKPVVADNTNPTGWDVEPNYRNENLRYAGILGPIAGLGLMAAGVGKPDKGAFDAVLNAYDGSGLALADYRPLGNYMTYRPMDMWAEQNRMNANARATDRALSNTSSPSRAAGLLANAYNNQLASGQLYRQGLEYNNNLNERVQTFNRQTDQYNADAYNRVALANAEAINRDRQYRAQLAMGIEGQKAAMDQGWYNSLYGNVGGIFKGLADVGRENAQHNMIAEMAANGLFGPMSPNTKVGRKGKYLTFTPTYVAKKGGELNRKKGGK